MVKKTCLILSATLGLLMGEARGQDSISSSTLAAVMTAREIAFAARKVSSDAATADAGSKLISLYLDTVKGKGRDLDRTIAEVQGHAASIQGRASSPGRVPRLQEIRMIRDLSKISTALTRYTNGFKQSLRLKLLPLALQEAYELTLAVARRKVVGDKRVGLSRVLAAIGEKARESIRRQVLVKTPELARLIRHSELLAGVLSKGPASGLPSVLERY